MARVHGKYPTLSVFKKSSLFLGLLMWWFADKTSATSSVAALKFLAMYVTPDFVWLGIFTVYITCRKASMVRYPQWSAYTRNSLILMPGMP